VTRTPTTSTGYRARSGSRREDIAAAAIELFLDRGVAATRVEDILAAAGVSVGSFYHHFRDKLSLAATVYLEHLQRFQRDLLVWRASHIPDTGPNKVRSGMEVDHCENVVASSVRNSRTRP